MLSLLLLFVLFLVLFCTFDTLLFLYLITMGFRCMMSSTADFVTRFLDLFSDLNENIMKEPLTTETILSTQALLVGLL